MKRLGIHIRLFLSAFLLIFATTMILDMVGVRITTEFMTKRFEDRISFLAKYLALNSEVYVLIRDTERLNTLVLNLLEEEDVARVRITDKSGETLVEQGRDVPGPLASVTTPVVLQKSSEENIPFQDLQTPFGQYQRLEEQFLGEVQITYSTYGISQLMREITSKFIWSSTGLAVLAGLVFYFVSRPIVREVKELAVAARQVGRGDLELRVRPGKLPETRSLANDFNAMLDSLNRSRQALTKVSQEMVQQKSLAEVGKFSLMVAHEVKNPLSIIKSSLEVLKKDLQIPDDDTMLYYIEDEIRRLNRLIEDFLIFARPTKPKFRPVDVNDMLTSIVERFQIQRDKAPAEITMDIPEDEQLVFIDQDLVVRSLSNIIKNGCDAAGINGLVRINSFSRDKEWVVRILDNGDGVAPENMKKIFDPFYTTRSKGTGLGLAFAMHVIRAHGGKISVKNRNEGGAEFEIIFPIRKETAVIESVS